MTPSAHDDGQIDDRPRQYRGQRCVAGSASVGVIVARVATITIPVAVGATVAVLVVVGVVVASGVPGAVSATVGILVLWALLSPSKLGATR